MTESPQADAESPHRGVSATCIADRIADAVCVGEAEASGLGAGAGGEGA